MHKQGMNLFQIGVLLAVAGVAIHVAVNLGRIFLPFANLAVVLGVILIIIGLVVPGRR